MGYTKEQIKEYKSKYYDDLNKHAIESITSGKIIDLKKWDVWCNRIKGGARKRPYYVDNDIIFLLMSAGCFYCGNIATTIDRIDSKLGHTVDNCVGCCQGCNFSKGTADSSTFIRKAYFRARREYADDITNIWFCQQTKPKIWGYKKSAEKKKIVFELTKEVFESLIIGDCEYCHRTPSKWFGIDRIIPQKGYVLDNVVTCCCDCNVDKHEADYNATIERNNRIADRVDTGDLLIETCEQTILHQGTRKSSKKVCAYGKMYASKMEASRALNKGYSYVSGCTRDGTHPGDIFEISNEFYEEHKYSDMYITKEMYTTFNNLINCVTV